MTYPLACPHCNANLDAGDIYDTFIEMGHDHERAELNASHYGWTPEKPQRFSRIVGQYDWDKDRTIGYKCPDCLREIIV